jgi:hypothetical protein
MLVGPRRNKGEYTFVESVQWRLFFSGGAVDSGMMEGLLFERVSTIVAYSARDKRK